MNVKRRDVSAAWSCRLRPGVAMRAAECVCVSVHNEVDNLGAGSRRRALRAHSIERFANDSYWRHTRARANVLSGASAHMCINFKVSSSVGRPFYDDELCVVCVGRECAIVNAAAWMSALSATTSVTANRIRAAAALSQTYVSPWFRIEATRLQVNEIARSRRIIDRSRRFTRHPSKFVFSTLCWRIRFIKSVSFRLSSSVNHFLT